MAQYGHIIDKDLVPEKRKIYRLLTAYFGNPKLTKIKDTGSHSMYAAMVDLLIKDFRYLIVLSPKDTYPKGVQFPLSSINWISLQTRTLNNELNCNKFTYIPHNKPPFDTRVHLNKRKEKLATYESRDYKFSLCLLHTQESLYEYPDLGTLSSALETYQTIIQIEV